MEIKDFNIISKSKKGDRAMIVHSAKGASVTRHATRIKDGWLWIKKDSNGQVIEDEFFAS